MQEQSYRKAILLTRSDKLILGTELTKRISKLLLHHTYKDNFDYRLIHLITEPKLLHERLQYICQNYFSDAYFNSLVDEYKALYNKHIIMRIQFMKNSLLQTKGFSIYMPPDNKKTAEQMSYEYLKLYETEKRLLGKMCPYINKLLFCTDEKSVFNTEAADFKLRQSGKNTVTFSAKEAEYISGVKIYAPEHIGKSELLSKIKILYNGSMLTNIKTYGNDRICNFVFPAKAAKI